MSAAKLTSKGQITIPKDIREYLKLGQGDADFADYLVGEANKQKACDYTATFDRKASKSNNFRLLNIQ